MDILRVIKAVEHDGFAYVLEKESGDKTTGTVALIDLFIYAMRNGDRVTIKLEVEP